MAAAVEPMEFRKMKAKCEVCDEPFEYDREVGKVGRGRRKCDFCKEETVPPSIDLGLLYLTPKHPSDLTACIERRVRIRQSRTLFDAELPSMAEHVRHVAETRCEPMDIHINALIELATDCVMRARALMGQ